MSLYGNSIYIIRSFCGIQTLDDLIGEDTVLGPAQRVLLIFILHVLCRSKGIKSQIRENASSSVEIRLIVMYCMGSIAQILQNIRRALTCSFLKDTLVRIFSRSKIMKAHSSNGFKLSICGSGSYGRYLIISGGILLHQLSEIRNRIF